MELIKITVFYTQIIFLPALIFIVINWIGAHSLSYGYVSMNVFVQRDESPAYNAVFRVIGPIISIILISSFYYYINQDWLVKNIWLITPIYFLYRFIFNIALNKWQLIDKKREIAISIISTLLTYIIYTKFISHKSNLLPDPANLTGELWIIIILYLYSTFNNIDVGTSGSEKRRSIYYKKYYYKFKSKYGDIISELKPSPILESLIYAIMMYENFNRPPLFRLAERIVFPIFSKTLGVMQVKTDKKISDKESVIIGANRISKKYKEEVQKEKTYKYNEEAYIPQVDEIFYCTQDVITEVLKDYNKDDDYIQGVNEMHAIIVSNFYPKIELYP